MSSRIGRNLRIWSLGVAFVVMMCVQSTWAQPEEAGGEIVTMPDGTRLIYPEIVEREEAFAVPLGESPITAEAGAQIVYDSLNPPATIVAGAGFVDTNGSLGWDSLGDDYSIASPRPTIILTNFYFRGQVVSQVDSSGGRAFFDFFRRKNALDVTPVFLKGVVVNFPSPDVTNWGLNMPANFEIPPNGYWAMRTDDASGVEDSGGSLYRADSAFPGTNFSEKALYNESYQSGSIPDPEILAFALRGDPTTPVLLPAVSADCCAGNNCTNAACRAKVAAIDPFCGTGWDEKCGGEAHMVCPDLCQSKNRYISFRYPNVVKGDTRVVRVQALTVYDESLCPPRPSTLPDLSTFNGDQFWLNGAVSRSDGASSFLVDDLEGSIILHFGEKDGVNHVYGPAILPCSLYRLQVNEDGNCSPTSCTYGPSLWVGTARWGDVNPGMVDVLDVSAVVDKVKGVAGALPKVHTQLQPNLVNPGANTSVSDISSAVDALKGLYYPFSP